MNAAKVILAILGFGGSAVAVTLWLPTLFPPKVHSWFIGIVAITAAISEGHFKSLISELQGLLRRGSYSSWQLDELTQAVKPRINLVWGFWCASLVMKMIAAVAAAALQWDKVTEPWVRICILAGYYLLILSFILVFVAWSSLRNAENLTNRLVQKENEIKEKNRLLKEIKSAPKHDFESDKVVQSYNKPAQQL